jgi:hypothetical protein
MAMQYAASAELKNALLKEELLAKQAQTQAAYLLTERRQLENQLSEQRLAPHMVQIP